MATRKTTPKAEEIKTDELPPVENLTADAAPDAEQTAPEADTPPPRRRGRPAGSASKTASRPAKSQAKKAQDTEAFAKQLVGIHQLVAMATGLPEMQIAEQEAQMLANGITAVTEEYGLALDGKTGAAIQLFGAAAMVYAPRYLAVRARMEQARKQAQAARQAEENAMVVDIISTPGEGTGHAAAH